MIRETQMESWEAIKPKLGPRQKEVLEELMLQPSTGFEISARLGRETYTVLPRINELMDHGLVVDSGVRRTNPKTKKKAIVWRQV